LHRDRAHDAPLVHFVRLLSAERGLGIILEKRIGPLPVCQGFALSYDFEEIVVPGLQPLSEFSIGFVPVGGEAGFSMGNPFAIPIANPPDCGARPPKDNPSYFLALGILDLLFKRSAKCFEIRFVFRSL
jgi:hypothetical protein